MEQSPLVGDRKPSYGSLARSVDERELSVRAGEIEGDTMLMRNSPIWNKFLFAIACLHTIGTSGVVLGWSALVPLLKQEHLYRDLCPPADDATICPEQENKLNLIYTCGIIGNYFSNVPFGWLMDKYGPKKASLAGSILFICGVVMWTQSDPRGLDLYAISLTLISLGGPAIQLPCFQFAHLFPGKEPTMIAILTALFDASSLVFFSFKLCNDFLGLSLSLMFWLLAGFGVWCFITTLCWWPDKAIPRQTREENIAKGSLSRDLSELSFVQMITSLDFFCVVVFVSVHVLRLNFVIGTFETQQQYYFLGDIETISRNIDIFNVILPLGFVCIPLIGYLLEHRGFFLTFFVINGCSIVYGILFMFPGSLLGLVVMSCIFAICRQMVYTTFFSYILSVFGVRYLGSLSGVNNLVTTGISSLQYALVYITVEYLDNNFVYIDVILLLTTVLCFAFLLLLLRDRAQWSHKDYWINRCCFA